MDTLTRGDIVGAVKIDANITREMVDDYLVTAFEGGINYWCKRIKVVDDDYKGGEFGSDVISRGGKIKIYCFEPPLPDSKNLVFTLTLDGVLDGIKFACKNFGESPESLYEMHDAITADVIVQYALFKEIIFG